MEEESGIELLTFKKHVRYSEHNMAVINERAHRGKRAVKATITILDRTIENAKRSALQYKAVSEVVPGDEGHTMRYGLHSFKTHLEQVSQAYEEHGKTHLMGLRTESAAMLETIRQRWPELQHLSKDARKPYDVAVKREHDLLKRMQHEHDVLDTETHNLEDYRIALATGAASPKKASGGRHQRSRSVISFMTRRSRATTQTGLDKLSKKTEKLKKHFDETTTAHQQSKLELEQVRASFEQTMGEILDAYQRLELERGVHSQNILTQLVTAERDLHNRLFTLCDELLVDLSVLDAAEDVQYFVRAARPAPNAWRRLSGNRPVITAEYHTPVSSWRAVWDESESMEYYFNDDTGESAWEPPEEGFVPSYRDLDEVEDPTPPRPLKEEYAHPMVPESMYDVPLGQLPQGWQQIEDPESGSTYYHNEVTGETSWSPPEEVAAAPRHERLQSESLWQTAVDEETGVPYFYNPLTNESRWA